MAKTLVKYLIASCICGTVALVLSIVCLSTDFWVNGKFTLPGADGESTIDYGLFTGTYAKRLLGRTQEFPIVMTCLFGLNACAWSCQSTQTERENEIEKLYNLGNGSMSAGCSVTSQNALMIEKAESAFIDQDDFLSPGLWVSTILFLCTSILLNTVAVGFNFWNIFGNPIETYASIFGLYIYYGIAAITNLLTLILWGAQFGAYCSNNVAQTDTILYHSEVSANVNWSYVLIAPALLEQLVAISMIYYRQYLINQEEAKKVIDVDTSNNNNANTFMY